jgi:hypothetical protein
VKDDVSIVQQPIEYKVDVAVTRFGLDPVKLHEHLLQHWTDAVDLHEDVVFAPFTVDFENVDLLDVLQANTFEGVVKSGQVGIKFVDSSKTKLSERDVVGFVARRDSVVKCEYTTSRVEFMDSPLKRPVIFAAY